MQNPVDHLPVIPTPATTPVGRRQERPQPLPLRIRQIAPPHDHHNETGKPGKRRAYAIGHAHSHSSFTVDDDVEVPDPASGEVWTVGAVILNRDGEAFAHKRSPDRRLFPDTWDIVGGHVEAGETVLEALAREVEEETGWRLTDVRRFLGTTTWTGDDGGGLRHEADYLVEVDGDLDNPTLEWSKHSRLRLVQLRQPRPPQREPQARGVLDPRPHRTSH
ncbi:NUDIX hydrolase [Streptomyces sp. ISL-1]|uniref:NUDIX hydrolase n=1 Tax=Streptomyces sp. ISL-1 TaxID=2817657 RepID=UPI002034EB43|nr:NUDIX domain-containing protein [Streptomyces sp. ISL-1]